MPCVRSRPRFGGHIRHTLSAARPGFRLERCPTEAPLLADTFEDLPGQWQAAILKAEKNRPNLRVVRDD